jgi:DNA-binding transcriptional MerR regulator
MTDTPRPAKLYYTIGEVAELTGVKPHVLRYWESEFPTLRPRKGRSGSRSYRAKDIDEIVAIRDLLYKEGFRIAGARKLRREAHASATKVEESAAPARPQLAIPFAQLDRAEQVAQLRADLVEVLALVRALGSPTPPKGK